MRLFIDADALPNALKPILVRAINRLSLETVVVSNRSVTLGRSKFISNIIVGSGADEADNRIVEMIEAGDLTVTADIPLADRVISKKAHAIDHRGKLFTANNIKQSLAIRNLNQEILEMGEMIKGAKPFNQKDAHNFANHLNQFLTKALQNPSL